MSGSVSRVAIRPPRGKSGCSRYYGLSPRHPHARIPGEGAGPESPSRTPTRCALLLAEGLADRRALAAPVRAVARDGAALPDAALRAVWSAAIEVGLRPIFLTVAAA